MAQSTALPMPRRPINLRWIGVAAVLALAIAALIYTGAIAQIKQRIPGLADATPTYQTTAPAKGNVVIGVTATGPLSAITNIPVSFKSSGKLTAVNVAVGDKVTKGQVLAEIDSTDLQVALAQAQSTLATAKAALAKLQAGPTDTQKQVAQISVDNAAASAADVAASLGTTKDTTSKDLVVSQSSVDSARASLATAQSSLKAAQDSRTVGLASDQVALTNAKKNLDTVKANVAANVPIYQQTLEKAKDDLYAQQVSRDAACGQPGSTQCHTANASLAGAITSLSQANAQYPLNLKQGDQQISAAQASVDSAQAQLTSDQSKLAAAVVSAQNALNQSQIAYDAAQASFASAQAKADATVQSAQAQITGATNSVKSAQANLNQLVAPPTQADIDTATSQIANAQAAVDTAQLNLDGAKLLAPMDGSIATISGGVGQTISGGPVTTAAAAFMTIVDLNNLQVTAQVNEADIGKVAVGNAVNFSVSAFPDKTFAGKVITMQPIGTTVQNVVTYNVTSSIQPSKDAQLLPGMTAIVTIVSAEHDNVTTVPNTAFTFAQAAFRQGLVQFNRQGQAPGDAAAGAGTPGPRAAGQGGQRAGAAGAGQTGPADAAGTGTPGTRAAGQGGQGQGFQRGAGAANRNVVMILKDGKLTPMPVTIGLTDGTTTEIVSGLNDGDEVVVGPIPRSTTGTATGTPGPGGRPATGPIGGPGPGVIRFGD
jgi:HlyD family secretion protein